MKETIKPFYIKKSPGETPEILTVGEFGTTACQENILTIIIKEVQEYTKQGRPLPVDKYNNPIIEIDLKDVGKNYNMTFVLENLDKLCSKSIKIAYIYDDDMALDFIPLFSSKRNIKNTNRIALGINPNAVSLFEFYGKGACNRVFSYKTALSLRGKYTKRIYKVICSLAGSYVAYKYSINQFKKDFMIPKTCSNRYVIKILRQAEKQIRKSESSIKVSFFFECKNSVKSKKFITDTIIIVIVQPA